STPMSASVCPALANFWTTTSGDPQDGEPTLTWNRLIAGPQSGLPAKRLHASPTRPPSASRHRPSVPRRPRAARADRLKPRHHPREPWWSQCGKRLSSGATASLGHALERRPVDLATGRARALLEHDDLLGRLVADALAREPDQLLIRGAGRALAQRDVCPHVL